MMSDRDRITRLEVLRESDRERVGEIKETVKGIDEKVDELLKRGNTHNGVVSAVSAVVGNAAPIIWGALFAVLWWAFSTYVGGGHRA